MSNSQPDNSRGPDGIGKQEGLPLFDDAESITIISYTYSVVNVAMPRYTFLNEIGTGGVGRVWLARDSRTRERTLGNNLSWLRRFAITRLKHHPLKESLRGKMQIAGWSDDFLAEVLTGQQL